jgi:antitoxin MazE
MGLEENSSIELMLKEGLLVVSPAREQRWKLEELLAAVTEENIHHEWGIGSVEGEEKW